MKNWRFYSDFEEKEESKMAQLTEVKALTDRILAGISVENVKETAFFFSKLKRATASPDAEAASAYICSKLSEYGIPHEQLWYSGYLFRSM